MTATDCCDVVILLCLIKRVEAPLNMIDDEEPQIIELTKNERKKPQLKKKMNDFHKLENYIITLPKERSKLLRIWPHSKLL